MAVHFDIPPAECVARVEGRVNHPTLPPHRGVKAVAAFASSFQSPSVAEGFERVHVIKCIEDASRLLADLGASAPPPV